MPPAENAPQTPIKPDHLLPPHQTEPIGPIVGTIIIVVLLIAGGLYFWGARLNQENAARNQAAYIPSGTTTRIAQ